MKTLSILIMVFLSLSQMKAQEQGLETVFKFYSKDGKDMSQEQLDSLEAVHEKLNFRYHYTTTEKIVVVNLISEKSSTPEKGGWTVKMVEQEDGTFKAIIPNEAPLKEKWIGRNIFQTDLKDMDGNDHTLGTRTGRLTVLNLWFAGCAPCIKEMPDLNKLVAEFKNDKVDFLALTFDSKERVIKFLSKRKFDYKIIPDAQEHMAKVWANDNGKKEDIDALYPVHFVVDENGVVQEVILGAQENIKELLRKAIQAQL